MNPHLLQVFLTYSSLSTPFNMLILTIQNINITVYQLFNYNTLDENCQEIHYTEFSYVSFTQQ